MSLNITLEGRKTRKERESEKEKRKKEERVRNQGKEKGKIYRCRRCPLDPSFHEVKDLRKNGKKMK